MTRRSRDCKGTVRFAAALVVSTLVALFTLASASAQPAHPTFVRITLGIGDTTGRDWSGNVRVDGGAIVVMVTLAAAAPTWSATPRSAAVFTSRGFFLAAMMPLSEA